MAASSGLVEAAKTEASTTSAIDPMNTPRIDSAQRAHLIGIQNETGTCSCCGQEADRLYQVHHPDGTNRCYRRECCAIITGLAENDLKNETTYSAAWQAIIEGRTTIVTAAFPDWDDGENRTNGFGVQVSHTISRNRYWPTGWRDHIESLRSPIRRNT